MQLNVDDLLYLRNVESIEIRVIDDIFFWYELFILTYRIKLKRIFCFDYFLNEKEENFKKKVSLASVG